MFLTANLYFKLPNDYDSFSDNRWIREYQHNLYSEYVRDISLYSSIIKGVNMESHETDSQKIDSKVFKYGDTFNEFISISDKLRVRRTLSLRILSSLGGVLMSSPYIIFALIALTVWGLRSDIFYVIISVIASAVVLHAVHVNTKQLIIEDECIIYIVFGNSKKRYKISNIDTISFKPSYRKGRYWGEDIFINFDDSMSYEFGFAQNIDIAAEYKVILHSLIGIDMEYKRTSDGLTPVERAHKYFPDRILA